MSLIVSFSIPEDKLDLKKSLDKLARREKCSRSEIIIRAIEEYIARHMKGNPAIPLDSFAGEVEFPETYELLQLFRRKYGSRRVLYWDEALSLHEPHVCISLLMAPSTLMAK